jgi:hypothetical protein
MIRKLRVRRANRHVRTNRSKTLRKSRIETDGTRLSDAIPSIQPSLTLTLSESETEKIPLSPNSSKRQKIARILFFEDDMTLNEVRLCSFREENGTRYM